MRFLPKIWRFLGEKIVRLFVRFLSKKCAPLGSELLASLVLTVSRYLDLGSKVKSLKLIFLICTRLDSLQRYRRGRNKVQQVLVLQLKKEDENF